MDWVVDNTIEPVHCLVLMAMLYLFAKHSLFDFNYWKKNGISHIKRSLFVGNFWGVIKVCELYNKFETPYIRMFISNEPCLVIKCPELIKQVLMKSCNSVNLDDDSEPMGSKFVFISKSKERKCMYSKTSCACSMEKLESIFMEIQRIAYHMGTYLEEHLKNKSFIETKALCAKYATDIIASCVFGVEARSFKYGHGDFEKIGKLSPSSILKLSLIRNLYFIVLNTIEYLKTRLLNSTLTGFTGSYFWENLKKNRTTYTRENDLIDIVTQIKKVTFEGNDFAFEGRKLAARAAHFAEAGLESISSTMTFALYELCLQKKIQNKVRYEIKQAKLEYKEFTHEALQDMPYLDLVLHETLRKHPTLPVLSTTCNIDYRMPENNLIMEKGTTIYIPVSELHHDTKYYTDPQRFWPERFCIENRTNLPEFAYIPFGKNPRSCIGDRYGYIAAKLGLAHILLDYEVSPNEKTPVSSKCKAKGLSLESIFDLPMTFSKVAYLENVGCMYI